MTTQNLALLKVNKIIQINYFITEYKKAERKEGVEGGGDRDWDLCEAGKQKNNKKMQRTERNEKNARKERTNK